MHARLRRTLHFIDTQGDETPLEATITYLPQGWLIDAAGASSEMCVARHEGRDWMLALNDATVKGAVVCDGDLLHVFSAGVHHRLRYVDPLLHAGSSEAEGGRLTAPMPGKVVAVLVQAGDAVEKGAPLLIMEAMKMEHTIAAPAAGTVDEVLYAVGDQVADGAQLLSLALATTDAAA
jgi:3-methylcrotonyl-CoA carboxylase alpha subunit